VAADDSAQAIGQRLRERRLALGLSQREQAARDVTYAYISRIEAGARRPSVRALRQLGPSSTSAPTGLRPAAPTTPRSWPGW
jgi:transcriptional regulator with XRE-family HTH domain